MFDAGSLSVRLDALSPVSVPFEVESEHVATVDDPADTERLARECVTPPPKSELETSPPTARGAHVSPQNRSIGAHRTEFLADSVRTEGAYTPSDLRKRADSHVEAELHRIATPCNTSSVPPSTASRQRAAIYLRISLDVTGEGLAVHRQRDDCLRIIEQRGWAFAGEYVDNSISASDARRNRPQYDALVRAYEAGEYDALVCYDLDRLTRQPRQLEDWIEAAERRGLSLVTANGEADLSTDGGRMFARVKLAVARAEVERKSARQRAAARQRSALGRPPLGVRLTGYTPRGDLVSDEAAMVARIFELFAAGDSLHSITRTLSAEGITTRHGRPWNPSSIRTMLTNPRYAGRAVYQGEETGQRGAWEPVVSDDLFNLVQARLNDPRRKTNRHGTDRKHLGSGLYCCAECGVPVRAWSGNRYRCPRGCVHRSMGPVDHFIQQVIAARLRRTDAADLLAATEADAAPLVAHVKRLRDRLDAIGEDYDAGHIDGARYAVASEKVRTELRSAERRLAGHASAAAISDTLSAPDPGAAFLAADLMRRRAVLDALCVVQLARGTPYSRAFDPETVRVLWRSA